MKRAAGLTLVGTLRNIKIMRSRVRTIALLCLVAHALFINVTHHHDTHRLVPASADTSLLGGGDTDSGNTPDTGRDGHCPSCCLQRNFIADAHTTAIIVEPAEGLIKSEIFLTEPRSHGPPLRLSNRAPPLA